MHSATAEAKTRAFYELDAALDKLLKKYGDDVSLGAMICKGLEIMEYGNPSNAIHYEMTLLQIKEYAEGAGILDYPPKDETMQ